MGLGDVLRHQLRGNDVILKWSIQTRQRNAAYSPDMPSSPKQIHCSPYIDPPRSVPGRPAFWHHLERNDSLLENADFSFLTQAYNAAGYPRPMSLMKLAF